MVSVTFRKMAPKDLITLAKEANLEAIEWGGDVHVPHGNVKRAEEVAKRTRDAGLAVSSYGSYYKVGLEGRGSPEFQRVLETAVALGGNTIRVWAGDKSSREAPDSWWALVVKETRRIADLAQKAGRSISFEFHGNTLNDSLDGARRLFRSIEHDNVRSYWQPDPKSGMEERRKSLDKLRRRLSNVHVYHWIEGSRRALSDGEDEWRQYMRLIADADGDRYALIEFVENDMPPFLVRDAATLRELIRRAETQLNEESAQ